MHPGFYFSIEKKLTKKNEFVGFEIEGRTVSILPVSVRRFLHIWKFTEQTMVYLAQCENSIAMSDRQLSCLRHTFLSELKSNIGLRLGQFFAFCTAWDLRGYVY